MDNDNKLCDKCGLRPQQKAQPKPCGCKPKKCCKKDCCNDNEFAFRKVVIPASLGDDKTGQDKPENGAYTNSYVEYEANGAQYMYDSYGVYTKIEGGDGGGGTLDFNQLENRPKYAGERMTGDTDIPNVNIAVANEATLREAADTALSGDIAAESLARQNADGGLQSQIDAISASSDVTDIVGTYAELQSYDTSTLSNNDIIKVLQDEEHDNETTYYRWSTATQTFTLIGEEGPYYTKSAADSKFQDKLTAGANVSIDQSTNTISATDTTYTDFVGTDGVDAGTAGLVPAPAVSDAGKYLKADGTWDSVQAGPSVVQTTGTSQTDVMSQAAATDMIWPGNDTTKTIIDKGSYASIGISTVRVGRTPSNGYWYGNEGVYIGSYQVATGNTGGSGRRYYETWIGYGAGRNNIATSTNTSYSTAIGYNTVVGERYALAIGASSKATAYGAIGIAATSSNQFSIAIGTGSETTRDRELSVGSGSGDNPTRYIANVTDPSLPQDAATKNYADNLTISYAALNGSAAPTTATEGKYVGQLYYDTTNEQLYFLKSIDDTVDPVEYTWEAVGGGSSVNVVQTVGTSTTDVMSQDAATKMVYANADGNGNRGICIPIIDGYSNRKTVSAHSIMIGTRVNGENLSGNENVSIGYAAGPTSASTNNTTCVGSAATAGSAGAIAIGRSAKANANNSVALGYNATASYNDSIAIGLSSTTTAQHAVSVGNANQRRVIQFVADPTGAQDAATKNYVDSIYPVGAVFISTSATAPTIAGGTWTEIGTQTIGTSTVHYYERTA